MSNSKGSIAVNTILSIKEDPIDVYGEISVHRVIGSDWFFLMKDGKPFYSEPIFDYCDLGDRIEFETVEGILWSHIRKSDGVLISYKNAAGGEYSQFTKSVIGIDRIMIQQETGGLQAHYWRRDEGLIEYQESSNERFSWFFSSTINSGAGYVVINKKKNSLPLAFSLETNVQKYL